MKQDESDKASGRDLDHELSSSAESLQLAEQQRRRRYLISGTAVVVLVLVVIVVAVWRWRKSSTPAEETVTPVVSVRVAKVEKGPISAPVSAVGTIFPRDQATVAPKISAQIRQMALLKNKVVSAGTVLARLESGDLVAQRNEAVAALNQERANERSVVTGTIPQTNAQDEKALRDARAKVVTLRAVYERRRELLEKGGISKKDLEASQMDLTTAENELRLAEQTVALRARSLNPNDRAMAAARVQAAQQRLATLDAQVGYATIRAPISGIITEQFQYRGDFAAAGAKLVTIADVSEVIVKAPFSDTVAGQLKVGDPAQVLPTDSAAEEMTGHITLVSRSSDPLNRTVEVWVVLGNTAGRLRANGAAQVTAATLTKNDAILVPNSAVTLDASNSTEGTVMVVDASSTANERKVVVGIRTPDKIEIVSGLQEGETVVIEGNYALPDGTKVEVNTAEEGAAAEPAKSEASPAVTKANVQPGASKKAAESLRARLRPQPID